MFQSSAASVGDSGDADVKSTGALEGTGDVLGGRRQEVEGRKWVPRYVGCSCVSFIKNQCPFLRLAYI